MIIPFSVFFLTLSLFSVCFAAAQEIPDQPGPSDERSETVRATASETTMKYGRHGSMRAQPGHRDAIVSILRSVASGLDSADCVIYVVSLAPDDPDLIWVTEVWESREAHAASLKLPAVRQAIEKAMPLLTGEFTGSEFEVVGGLGIPEDGLE